MSETGACDARRSANAEALASLNSAFRGSLLGYFTRRAANLGEADDLVQEVFERLLKRGDLADVGHLRGYVFETASNVLTDRLRSQRSRHAGDHVSFNDSVHGGVDFSPEHVLLERENLARAVAALQRLQERTRAVFVLRRLEGMKYREIAARLNISVSAVEKHMERAIAHLKRSLDQP